MPLPMLDSAKLLERDFKLLQSQYIALKSELCECTYKYESLQDKYGLLKSDMNAMHL